MALIKKPVTGMKDILPAEMEIRDYCISVIKKTYAEFGFQSIETPCFPLSTRSTSQARCPKRCGMRSRMSLASRRRTPL